MFIALLDEQLYVEKLISGNCTVGMPNLTPIETYFFIC